MTLNRNNFLYLFLSFFLFSFNNGNKKKNDLTYDNLHGNVKSVKIFFYKKTDEKTLAINPLAISNTDRSFIMIINYNGLGNVTDNIGNNYKKLLICNYDSTGNRINSVKFDKNENVIARDTSRYDWNRNLIEHVEYELLNEKRIMKEIYKYDDKGNKIEMNEYVNNEFSEKTWFKYDVHWNEIEEDFGYNTSIPTSKIIKKHDDKGNVKEYDYYNDSSLNKYKFNYNAYGSVTEERKYDSGNNLLYDYIYKYDYDVKGNWIRKLKYIIKEEVKDDHFSTFDDEHQPPVTIRVIEYY
jgi:hypothetical protein